LISEFTLHQLQEKYLAREVDVIRVKGKAKPVSVYEILDFHDARSFPHLHEVLSLYQSGLTAYRQRQWPAAMRSFAQALTLHRNDGATRLYLDRCQYFVHHPPAPDWDGVWVMESK
jgi:adenylate cyclase